MCGAICCPVLGDERNCLRVLDDTFVVGRLTQERERACTVRFRGTFAVPSGTLADGACGRYYERRFDAVHKLRGNAGRNQTVASSKLSFVRSPHCLVRVRGVRYGSAPRALVVGGSGGKVR